MVGNTTINRVYLNRRTTLQFIQMYKENECLYNPSDDNYHNRGFKNDCLQSILHELQKFVPELNLENVKSKIKTIRTQLAHELTLIEAMELAGIPYKPRLWCFKHLTFLCKFMSRWPSKEKKMSGDESDSNDEGKSFYRELIANKPNRRPIVPRRTNFKWTREFTQLFIKQHKKKKCLYDINHVDFRDREKRYESRQQMLDEMKVSIPWITMEDIWLKHKCLRDQYTKELRAVLKAKAENIPYEPKLWCFQQLTYLRPYDNEAMLENDEDSDDSTQKTEIKCTNSVDAEGVAFEDFKQQDEVAKDKVESKEATARYSDCTDNIDSEDEADNINDDDTMHHETDSNRDGSETQIDDFNDLEKNLHLNDFNYDMADDEIEYDESLLKSSKCSYIELHHEIPNLKQQQKSSAEHVKIEKIDNKSSEIENQNLKSKICPQNDFQWLGNMVTSQLNDISPSHRSEFAWDIQCLVRKYVLKSKAKGKEYKTSMRSDPDCDENVLLPRTASLNISFL